MSTEAPPEAPGAPSDDELTMGIDPWERNWMKVSVALLVIFAAAITISGFAAGFQLPGPDGEVDPRTVLDEGPWSDPGVREIVLPVGAEVDIYVTSADLQHGFKITDTNVNMQIVPGQVSKLSFTFDEVGEFPYICHEYCGTGHAAMFGTVKVVSEADYAAQTTDTASETADATTDTTPTETTEATG